MRLPKFHLLKQCIKPFRPGCPGYGHLSRRGLKDQTGVVSSCRDPPVAMDLCSSTGARQSRVHKNTTRGQKAFRITAVVP